MDPGADMPRPIGHVLHAAHAWLPTIVLKRPLLQSTQVRSLLSVAGLLMYWPMPQTERTSLHSAALSESEYCTSRLHATHSRSVSDEPCLESPSPFGHVRQRAHASFPTVVLNQPVLHTAHWRSDDAPGGAVWYMPTPHVDTLLHSRSEVPVGPLEVYSFAPHESLCVWHLRSVVVVGFTISNSSAGHMCTALHVSTL